MSTQKTEQKSDAKKTQSVKTLKRLMGYLKHYWFFLAVSILMAFISVALTLYLPILTGNAVDCILGPGAVDFAGIRHILLVMAVCIGITAIAQWIMNVCNNKMTYSIVRDVRRDAFDKIETVSYTHLTLPTNSRV